MGERLQEMYRRAEAMGGMVAKLRLARETAMTSLQAESEPDSPEAVERFARALADIEREAGPRGGGPSGIDVQSSRPSESALEREQRLRHHLRVYLDLMSQRWLFLGDVQRTIARVTEAAATTLAVGRASVWFFDDERTVLRCADLYQSGPRKHSAGAELFASDFPAYFRALDSERTIAAHDAGADPRTSEFSVRYLQPLGIQSMLDVPIWAAGKMIGVVCHEHTGPRRHWIADEENFAFLMAIVVALAEENRRLRT